MLSRFVPVLLAVFFAGLAGKAGAQSAPVDLGTLPGFDSSIAIAMNASGQVVGNSYKADGTSHAFSWTATGGMIDLGTLGGSYSYATAVSDIGQVVGSSGATADDGVSHAFSWTAAGGMIDLGTIADGYGTVAMAVNSSGQVVGYSSDGWGPNRAFSWTAATGMIDLGTLGHDRSYAVAVNSGGQVVGINYRFTDDGTPSRAFSWTASGGMIDLGTLGGNYSSAAAVSASGQVVGSSETAAGSLHAFLWSAAGGMIDLGTLGGEYNVASQAIAITASGQVIGISHRAEGPYHGFSWTASGGMIDLGTLGGEWSYPHAVSANGQVVGSSPTGESDPAHAFSWTATGGMIDLGTLGGSYSYATAVNASGQVVGNSYKADGSLRAAIWQTPQGALPAVADAYVRGGASASTNFSASRKLLAKLGVTSDNHRRSYLKFDISDLDTIGKATLRLYGRVSNTSTARVRVGIFRVNNQSWEEQTVTWSTKPSYGPLLGVVKVIGTTSQWVEIDVTAFLEAEQRAGRAVVSVALRALEHTSAYASFDSREAGSLGPQLVITRSDAER
jgi:probable HAF family extracellular repeat protein